MTPTKHQTVAQKFDTWRARALQTPLDQLSPPGTRQAKSKASGPLTALLIALGGLSADTSLVSDIHTAPGSEPSTSPRIVLEGSSS